MADLLLFECLTTDLDNLSKKPFFFLIESFGVESGVMSGGKNASTNDETEEDLVCLPDKGPLAVALELSPLETETPLYLNQSLFSLGILSNYYQYRDQGEEDLLQPGFRVRKLP